jgi:hypothetical protein
MQTALSEFDAVLDGITPRREVMEAVVVAEFGRDEVERLCTKCASQADAAMVASS